MVAMAAMVQLVEFEGSAVSLFSKDIVKKL
jgi:hypothetical protein